MQSHLTPEFRDCYRRLPQDVRRAAREAFRQWKADPFATGLHFKEINKAKQVWSARISLGWRVLGRRVQPDVMV